MKGVRFSFFNLLFLDQYKFPVAVGHGTLLPFPVIPARMSYVPKFINQGSSAMPRIYLEFRIEHEPIG